MLISEKRPRINVVFVCRVFVVGIILLQPTAAREGELSLGDSKLLLCNVKKDSCCLLFYHPKNRNIYRYINIEEDKKTTCRKKVDDG